MRAYRIVLIAITLAACGGAPPAAKQVAPAASAPAALEMDIQRLAYNGGTAPDSLIAVMREEIERSMAVFTEKTIAWRDVVVGKNSSVLSSADAAVSYSIVAPDLLFPEVDVKAEERGRRGTPSVPSPLRGR